MDTDILIGSRRTRAGSGPSCFLLFCFMGREPDEEYTEFGCPCFSSLQFKTTFQQCFVALFRPKNRARVICTALLFFPLLFVHVIDFLRSLFLPPFVLSFSFFPFLLWRVGPDSCKALRGMLRR